MSTHELLLSFAKITNDCHKRAILDTHLFQDLHKVQECPVYYLLNYIHTGQIHSGAHELCQMQMYSANAECITKS